MLSGDDLFVVVVGLAVGLLCGLVPLLVGLLRGHKILAFAGLFCCLISGATIGLYLAVPVAILFAVVGGRLAAPDPAPTRTEPKVLDAIPVSEPQAKAPLRPEVKAPRAPAALDPQDLPLHFGEETPEDDRIPVAKLHPPPRPAAPKSEPPKPRQAPPKSEPPKPRQVPPLPEPPKSQPPKRKPGAGGFGYVELE